MKIALTKDDFDPLIRGGEIRIVKQDVRFTQASDSTVVNIILQDIGYDVMINMIFNAAHINSEKRLGEVLTRESHD